MEACRTNYESAGPPATINTCADCSLTAAAGAAPTKRSAGLNGLGRLLPTQLRLSLLAESYDGGAAGRHGGLKLAGFLADLQGLPSSIPGSVVFDCCAAQFQAGLCGDVATRPFEAHPFRMCVTGWNSKSNCRIVRAEAMLFVDQRDVQILVRRHRVGSEVESA
jgi:hypothetical protein